MGKQTFDKIKKTLAILLAVIFVVSLTAASVSAAPPGGFGKGDGGPGWNRGGGHNWDRDDWGQGGWGHNWGQGGWKNCGWWNNWCRWDKWDRWGHGW
jgi:hypothetical protein